MPHVVNVNTPPFNAVGMLRMTFSDGGIYFGSGALIRNQWVLTCAHNLHVRGVGGAHATAVSFHPRSDAGFPAGGGTAADHVFYPARFVTGAGGQGDESWDIGLVHLGAVIGAPPYFTMQLVADTTLQGEEVTITGYPGNHGGLMWTGTDAVAGINLAINALAYTHVTDFGSSGSPVYQYANNVARLYAVHVMRDNPDVRIGILLTQAVHNWINSILPGPMPGSFLNQV